MYETLKNKENLKTMNFHKVKMQADKCIFQGTCMSMRET